MNITNRHSSYLENFSHSFANWAGRGSAFLVAIFSLVIWIVIGKLYNFSNTWENAFTIYISVITFLMIFLMQRSQKKEFSAIHLKLNEIITATQGTNKSIITVEDRTEKEMQTVHENHRDIAKQNAIETR